MGLMRNFSMRLKVNGVVVAKNEYFTDDAMISDFLEILSNNNVLHLAESGGFQETTTALFPDKKFIKGYALVIDIPPIEFLLKKKSKGNINTEIFMEKIHLYRSKYERKKY